MNATQTNTLRMYGAVKLVLVKNQDRCKSVPGLVKGAGELDGGIQQIHTLELSRNSGTKGLTSDKQSARDAMTTAAFEVAGAVRAHASTINSGELREKVEYTPTELNQARDIHAVTICQEIHDTANSIGAPLAEFGVSEQDLKAYQDKITAFIEALARPRELVSNHRASVELLEKTFETLDALLEDRMDGMMEKFRTTEPAFFTAYSAARETISHCGGHAAHEDGSNGGDGANGGNGGTGAAPTPPPTTAAPIAQT